MIPDMPKNVAEVFGRMPDAAKPYILKLRAAIFDAAEKADVGTLEETLKWGEMSYLPKKAKVGTTIRIGAGPAASELRFFVSCQTKLLDIYRDRFPTDFTYVDNRAVHIDTDKLNSPALTELAALALTYHRAKLGVR